MIKAIPNRLWNHFQSDSLFRNSVYLMISTGVMSVLGFAFWIFVARLFSTKDVGIATTLISVITLLSNFSLLGLNTSLIRYLPKSTQRNDKINSVLLLILIASIFVSLIFLGGLNFFSPKLAFLQTKLFYIVTFVIFVIGLSYNTVVDSIFIAYRSTGNVLIKNSILSSLKLIFPLFFVFLGSYGVFASVGLATLLSAFAGFIILLVRFQYQPAFSFNKDVIREMAVFSGGNYVASFLSRAPNLVLPLFFINHLSAETSAYFYVDMMILWSLAIVSDSTTQSLLAEGSHDETKLRGHFFKATKFIFIFLVPAILLIVLFGNIILHAFGKDYASAAFAFLQIISFSSIFMSISSLATAILRINHKIKTLIFMNILGFILILGLSYLFIDKGLIGIGWGWLLGQALLALAYLVLIGKDLLSKKDLLIRFPFLKKIFIYLRIV